MKKKLVIPFFVLFLFILFFFVFYWLSINFQWFSRGKNENNLQLKKISNMNLSSPAFQNNGKIPVKYTCDGENINPPLIISDIPNKTKSLVLIVDDPDAPMGTWLHWTVFNIDPKTKEISENSIPSGALEGITDFGSIGYGGPCPPSGTHRYFFKLYALDIKLDLSSGVSKEEIEKAIEGHILDKAELIGLYSH